MSLPGYHSPGDRLSANEWNALVRRVIEEPWFGSNDIRAVELKDPLVPGGSATGWYLTWDSDLGEYSEPDYEAATDATAYDPQGRFRSLGYDDVAEGERGAIVFVDSHGAIIGGQQQARLCLCQLTAAKTGSDTSFTVDTVTVMDGGQVPLDDSDDQIAAASQVITAYNVSAGAGADNAVACIAWNENTDHWEIQWIINTSQAVVTDYGVDTEGATLWKKTRTLWGNWAGTESEETTVHTGDECVVE